MLQIYLNYSKITYIYIYINWVIGILSNLSRKPKPRLRGINEYYRTWKKCTYPNREEPDFFRLISVQVSWFRYSGLTSLEWSWCLLLPSLFLLPFMHSSVLRSPKANFKRKLFMKKERVEIGALGHINILANL